MDKRWSRLDCPEHISGGIFLTALLKLVRHNSLGRVSIQHESRESEVNTSIHELVSLL